MGLDMVLDTLQRSWTRLNLDPKRFSGRKFTIGVLIFLGFILYLGPVILNSARQTHRNIFNPLDRCLRDRTDPFNPDISTNDAIYSFEDHNDYVSFIGNGYLGFETKYNSNLYVRINRTLSFSVPYKPVLKAVLPERSFERASVLHLKDGIANTVECFSHGRGSIDVVYQLYAHRTMPSVFIQTIQVTNPTTEEASVNVENGGESDSKSWQLDEEVSLTSDGETMNYRTLFGVFDLNNQKKKLIIAIASPKLPKKVSVKPHSSLTLHVVTGVFYGIFRSSSSSSNQKEEFVKQALTAVANVVSEDVAAIRSSHISAWHQIWSTGFSVSYSKAEGALNGQQINATMYYTLSQVRAPLHEAFIKESQRTALHTQLEYTEGCFSGHHTLQAPKLWTKLKTLDDVQYLTNLWLLTLEKRGCDKLVKSGADGVVLAMVLSFGGLKFSDQHLEFNTHPSDFHRDHYFRRISYGNSTHVNITVSVMPDNRAAIYVALDRSDGHYYACDAGCLDPPVELKNEPVQFPVKLTDPLTSVLYITSDKVHMEELKHAIHVREINEAPAHEQHVIALHKHGNQWGWIPTLFWATVFLFIILFHLFLFRIIYQEYCGGQNQDRIRSRKFSDF
ncbi:uncharacterized protein KIAA2013 homolog [Artemia franciscana]|uniref:uncharacterized protein KIAA2013 homolog n=1 Tax=Artemia franciscana TaxID=6661 RepID=UPI0032DA83BB